MKPKILAIIGIVLALIGLLVSFDGISLLATLPALFLGYTAYVKSDQYNGKGRGVAVVALALGSVGLAAFLFFYLFPNSMSTDRVFSYL